MRQAILFASVCTSFVFAADTVHVEQGLISGMLAGIPEVHVYKGIPYAAPPVGNLRWTAPRPVASWQGVRDGSKFGNACPQLPFAKDSVYWREAEPMSEDCLFLNVWTGAKSAAEKRPVMVWIYGGAGTRGSGSNPAYSGEQFARRGVVLVTFNYRLGILGSLAHPELSAESGRKVSGNYFLLDQIAALQWVKKNIAAFGGDPDKVTIFGQSFGSNSVNFLTASPLARGLFVRAIGESGASLVPMLGFPYLVPARTLTQGEEDGLKVNASLKMLRGQSVDELLKVSFPPRAIVDGWVLSEDVYSIYAHGKQNDVPVLAGSTGDEATTLASWPENGTVEYFRDRLTRQFGEGAEDFLKVFPATDSETAHQAYLTLVRDHVITWPMRTWVRMQEATGKSKAWLYQFTRIPPGPDSARYRAHHSSEIAYVFGNLISAQPWEPIDRDLSSRMMAYWINFAVKGDPNGKGLPQWPAYTRKTDQSITLGDKITVTTGLERDQLDFLDRYYNQQRGGK